MTGLSRLTIRARITGGSLLIAVLISVIAGVVIYSQVQRIVVGGQTAVLQSVEAPYLTALTETTDEEVDPPGPGQLVAVVDPARVVKVDTLPNELKPLIERLETGSASSTVGGYLVRVTSVPTSRGNWTVISATSNDLANAVLSQVAVLLIASIAGINLAFGAASWLIGSAALKPVARLRRSAAELVAGSSTELLPVGSARDEIAELADTLNALITQLRTSAERERQIVSDASHEFRTPLAIIQTRLELAIAESSSLEQMQADVIAAQATLERLSTLARSMLELSRLDAQSVAGSASAEELAAELADAADRGRQRVGGRAILIEYQIDTAPQSRLSVSVADFGRVCDNLVSNALCAMGAEGVIELVLKFDNSSAVLVVRDSAGGMNDEFVALAFDRFSQADASRTRGGAGLGLPIVSAIATSAGGSVTLDNRPGDGVTVTVRFAVELEAERTDARPASVRQTPKVASQSATTGMSRRW